ncbi:MAG: sigma-70 family RNA polymerase sigma factor [Marinoscillum sp.]
MSFISSDTDIRSDEELLKQFEGTNDVQMLGVLFNRYVHLVYGLCLKYLKDRDVAQDAVMSIFESLHSKLKTHEVKYFKSWLYMVSKNYCLMELRKLKPTEKMNGAFMENQLMMHPIEEEEDVDENVTALEHCLEQLKKDQQACVRLFYLKEMSYEEVSRKTSFKLSKVKSYIQNGKRNLRICLERQDVKA